MEKAVISTTFALGTFKGVISLPKMILCVWTITVNIQYVTRSLISLNTINRFCLLAVDLFQQVLLGLRIIK